MCIECVVYLLVDVNLDLFFFLFLALHESVDGLGEFGVLEAWVAREMGREN